MPRMASISASSCTSGCLVMEGNPRRLPTNDRTPQKHSAARFSCQEMPQCCSDIRRSQLVPYPCRKRHTPFEALGLSCKEQELCCPFRQTCTECVVCVQS